MQLIVSIDIEPDILELINKSYSKKRDLLLSKSEIIKQIEAIVHQEDADIFAFLIAIGKLDIKLVYKLNNGIFHDKFGIISDGRHNLVYIGSNNFTEAATMNNDEAFQVTIDWERPSNRELNTIKELNLLFDELWTNGKKDVITIELPDPIISEMVDNINYEKVKKYTNETEYVRLDIDDEDNIIITSNIELQSFLTYKSIGEFSSSKFLKKEEKCYRFVNVSRIAEKKYFFEKLKMVLEKNNKRLYLTSRAKKYFELNYRNYDDLSRRGQEIKDNSFLLSTEFNFFKESINQCLNRPLKDKQIQAAIHIIKMFRSLNFSVPGSGKTATVLGAFEYLSSLTYSHSNYVNRLIIIGPINCAKSWRDEYAVVSKFSNEQLPLCLINSDNIEEKKEVLFHDFSTSRVIIINYEILPKIEHVLCKLLDEKSMIVFDEIHRIKRIDSPKYLALRKIVKNTRYRVALTGTPLPNGYVDLFNMINLLHDDFTQSYFQMFESGLKHDDDRFRKSGLQNSELNKRLFPFYMRINKNDLNVPLAEPDHIIEIQANDYEIELYNKIIKDKYSHFERTIKLLEVGCVPFKCSQSINQINNLTVHEEVTFMTSKLCKFLSIVKKNDNKCVVWCIFIDTIKIVTDLLNKNGI